MIIYLQFPSGFWQREISPEDLDALIDLGEAGYKGKHFVYSSRDILVRLSGLRGLSRRAAAYFSRVASEYSQFGGVIRSSKKYLVADPSIRSASIDGSVWKVPLRFFSQDELVQPSNLLCENDNDFDVYRSLAVILSGRDFPGLSISLRSLPGGGASSAGVLQRAMSFPNPICLCVVDSDKKFPGDAEGSTAKACRKVWKDDWRVGLIVLSARELENLLPTSLVRQCTNSIRKEIRELDLLENLPFDIRLFVCLKGGDSICRFGSIGKGCQDYERVQLAIEETGRRFPDVKKCGDGCLGVGCLRTPQYGGDFLAGFGQWLAGNFRFISTKCEDWSDGLISVLSEIISYGLALPIKR